MKDIEVKSIDDIAPYSGPNAIAGIRFRPARAALGVTAWGMNVLDLDPGCTGYPEHDHAHDEQEEVYVVLTGEVSLVVGQERTPLRAGDMVRVPATVRRKLVTEGSGARVLAIGATPGAAFKATM